MGLLLGFLGTAALKEQLREQKEEIDKLNDAVAEHNLQLIDLRNYIEQSLRNEEYSDKSAKARFEAMERGRQQRHYGKLASEAAASGAGKDA